MQTAAEPAAPSNAATHMRDEDLVVRHLAADRLAQRVGADLQQVHLVQVCQTLGGGFPVGRRDHLHWAARRPAAGLAQRPVLEGMSSCEGGRQDLRRAHEENGRAGVSGPGAAEVAVLWLGKHKHPVGCPTTVRLPLWCLDGVASEGAARARCVGSRRSVVARLAHQARLHGGDAAARPSSQMQLPLSNLPI